MKDIIPPSCDPATPHTLAGLSCTPSDLVVTGLYLYDGGVFDVIKTLKPSGRGELEIMDVNNEYIRQGAMGYSVLDGYWSDAGTFESLLRAGVMVKKCKEKNNYIKLSCYQTSINLQNTIF